MDNFGKEKVKNKEYEKQGLETWELFGQLYVMNDQ